MTLLWMRAQQARIGHDHGVSHWILRRSSTPGAVSSYSDRHAFVSELAQPLRRDSLPHFGSALWLPCRSGAKREIGFV